MASLLVLGQISEMIRVVIFFFLSSIYILHWDPE